MSQHQRVKDKTSEQIVSSRDEIGLVGEDENAGRVYLWMTEEQATSIGARLIACAAKSKAENALAAFYEEIIYSEDVLERIKRMKELRGIV